MKRWGAALACGLILATSFTGVADAASPAPPSSKAAAPTSCTPLREGHFGDLAADQIGTGEVLPGETGCHEVALTAGPHYLQIRNDARPPRFGTVRDASGNQVCDALECDIPASGVYTVQLANPTSQTLTYRTAVIRQDAAHCTTRVRTAWNTVTAPAPSTDLEANCVRFTGSDGEKVYVYNPAASANVRKLDGSLVCHLPTSQYNDPCRLTGAGTFLAMTAAPAAATSNEIQVRSVTDPKGCPVHEPKPFGSTNRFSDVRCRVLDVPAAGTYLVRFRTPANVGQLTGVLAPDGKPVCTTTPRPVLQQEVCTFPAAGRYLVIAETMNNRIVTSSFTTTFAAMNGPGCKATTTQGVAGPNARGKFRAVGQVDCWEFPTPWESETSLVLPPNASGAGVPVIRYYDSDNNVVCSTVECDLPGPATFRMLVTAPADATTGDYIFALQDKHSIWNCRPWDPSVTVSFRPGQFTQCFDFVPDRNAPEFEVAMQRTSGAGTIRASVRPTAGPPCEGGDQMVFTCEISVGTLLRLVLTADPTAAKYQITRSYGSAPEPEPEPDPEPEPEPEPPTCTSVTEARYGPLAPEQIGTVTVPAGQAGCHDVKLTAGWHYIQVRGAGNSISAFVRNANGDRVCLAPRGVLWRCLIRTTGEYAIEVSNRYGTEPISYRVAAVLEDPADCTGRISTAWDAAPVRIPTGDPLEAHCTTFEGTAGDKILGFSETGILVIYDASGTGVCGFPSRYNPPCELTGPGPYRVSTIAPPDGGEDEIQIRSLTPAVGCPAVTVGGTDQPSGIRCRSLTVPAAGTYDVTALGTGGDTRSITIRDADGASPCETAGSVPLGKCTFPAAGTYTLIADGHTSVIRDAPFTVSLAATSS
ncbi:hypothetical protein JIG36_42750 [Actinoplanes sp. LDG1-06]|uniref:Uncharacterized protein n=1 Tax=Paractinoplanes ovalisporus TaxID=2810368 RepID=A0ABS2AQU9_9ACTN|nr:PPC domain-containing protein [Actinoplanes ovalisporus]MBM2622244.1 hypothetical protein [Actinoplanes ovalisporus]